MIANLLVFANKRYNSDFRKYLMRAAERSGARALHLFAHEKLILSWGGAERAEYVLDCNLETLQHAITEFLQPGPTLGLTGLGGADLKDSWVEVIGKLHHRLSDVYWIYDVYDDFLFNTSGSRRVRRMITDAVWRVRCERPIVLDPELQSRYPCSYHLDNASHLHLIPSVSAINSRKMVYVGSIDSRVDFGWLDALAANDVTIGVFGSIHGTAPETKAVLDALLKKRMNITFHRPYDNDDLKGLLSEFRVGLLPYRVRPPNDRPCESGQAVSLLKCWIKSSCITDSSSASSTALSPFDYNTRELGDRS